MKQTILHLLLLTSLAACNMEGADKRPASSQRQADTAPLIYAPSRVVTKESAKGIPIETARALLGDSVVADTSWMIH